MNANKLLEPKWYAMTTIYGMILAITIALRIELYCLLIVAASLCVCFTIYEVNKHRIRTRYSIPVVIRKLNDMEDSAIQIVLVAHASVAILLAARYYIFFW